MLIPLYRRPSVCRWLLINRPEEAPPSELTLTMPKLLLRATVMTATMTVTETIKLMWMITMRAMRRRVPLPRHLGYVVVKRS